MPSVLNFTKSSYLLTKVFKSSCIVCFNFLSFSLNFEKNFFHLDMLVYIARNLKEYIIIHFCLSIISLIYIFVILLITEINSRGGVDLSSVYFYQKLQYFFTEERNKQLKWIQDMK